MSRTGGDATSITPCFDLYWLEEMLKGVSYGEVGIAYTLHDGKITNTRYILETKSKANAETGPPALPFIRHT